ncbi:MAG: hypothetical protein O9284_14630 [Steroidobacteraceae bacterium]|jgi:hypothetical protein|nr:hypothetical protein [Steroidobacteraceae bacterium]
MYFLRVGAMRRHRVHPERPKRVAGALPPEILGSGDNFRHLCELPVLS